MRLGACIDTLYTHLPWYDRLDAAKSDGFDAVEFWDWRNVDIPRAARRAKDAGILISGFNGDADFSPVDPSHKTAYLDYLTQSIHVAQQLNAPSVTIHSLCHDGYLGSGGQNCRARGYSIKFGSLKHLHRSCGQFLGAHSDGRRNLPHNQFS